MEGSDWLLAHKTNPLVYNSILFHLMIVNAGMGNIPDMPTDLACNRLLANACVLLRTCAKRKAMGDLIFSRLRKFRSGVSEQEAYLTG
eukprot:7065310-Pyramimonas_sp.AAC.1